MIGVFHHDEGVHGYLTYKLFKHGGYHYDPTYHGHFLYYSTAAAFTLFGDSRLMGSILTATKIRSSAIPCLGCMGEACKRKVDVRLGKNSIYHGVI